MKFLFYFLPFLFMYGSHHTLQAQYDPNKMEIINQPGQLLKADAAWTDNEGWTHYYNEGSKKLLLSLQTKGINIGTFEEGLDISVGLLNSYAQQAQDLSDADYVNNSIWMAMNRYWRIRNAQPIAQKMKIRFYFDQQDFMDVKTGLKSFGSKLNEQIDLEFFTLSNASLHPFSVITKPSNANFIKYDARRSGRPQWFKGNQNGITYAEFEINTLKISGGAGLMVKLSEQMLTATGQVLDQNKKPLSGIAIQSNQTTIANTNAEGRFVVKDLLPGKDYTLQPVMEQASASALTVLDLIGISQHTFGIQKLTNPYQLIAADVNANNTINSEDMQALKNQILGNQLINPKQQWQFVQQDDDFEQSSNPFAQKVDRFIQLDNILTNQNNVNFVGVQTGDIHHEKGFPNHPPSILDPLIAIDDNRACGDGELVSVYIKADDFKAVHGFQFGLSWDPAIIEFVEVSEFNLPQLDASNFGTAQIDRGELRVVWFTPNVTKANIIKNNTPIFKLTFRSIGANGSSSKINFNDAVLPFQILRSNLSEANANLSIGNIKIDNSTPIRISKNDIELISCNGLTDGRIKIKAKGGKAPYQYQWSNGNTGRSIEGLPKGSYQVTITDAVNCPLVSETFEITEPLPIAIKEKNIKEVACPEDTDGKIAIKVNQGTAPYKYEWSNGSKKETLKNVGGGRYTVTVTDDNGCTQSADFNIPIPGQLFISHVVADANSNNPTDGQISIMDVAGGEPPFSYKWSNGAKSPSILDLNPGNYSVSVIDKNGCENIVDFALGKSIPKPDFKVEINQQKEPLFAGTYGYLTINSAVQQTVQFKVYNTKGGSLYTNSMLLKRGKMTHYLKAPEKPGVYLVQIIAQGGKVSSLRMKVE